MSDGMSKRIKNAVMTLVEGITYGDANETAFYVIDSGNGNAPGYPLVRIVPGDIDDTKVSVRENERSVNLLLLVVVPREAKGTDPEAATYDKMYDLTDLILDTLDQADADGQLSTIDPTLTTNFLNATRGDWYLVEENDGVKLVCDINVTIRYSKQLN